MSQKREEKGIPIPIKNYDFQVDFKVNDEDVMQTFLDPAENKHISVLKRPQTAKTSTWGTPKPLAKKFETVQTTESSLAIKGTSKATTETVQADNPLPSNILYFKSHLPLKKMSDNPKLALSMFKKKTISAKSEKTVQASANFSSTGFYKPDESGNLQIPPGSSGYQGNLGLLAGLPTGKKLTVKAATQLKDVKEANALKSSGAAHGLFVPKPGTSAGTPGDRPGTATTGETKKKVERPKSAVVSAAVGFMQDLKRTKKLKAPKKPDFDLPEEEEGVEEVEEDVDDKENNRDNQDGEEEKSTKRAKPQAISQSKSVKTKKTEELNEVAPPPEEEEDGEDLGGTENAAGLEGKGLTIAGMILAKRKMQELKPKKLGNKNVMTKKTEEFNDEGLQNEEEGGEEDEDLGGTGFAGESLSVAKMVIEKKKLESQGKKPQREVDDEVQEFPSDEIEPEELQEEGQGEEQEGNLEGEQEEGDKEEGREVEEEEKEEGSQAGNQRKESVGGVSDTSQRKFRSNMANGKVIKKALSEFQDILAAPQDSLSDRNLVKAAESKTNAKTKKETPKEQVERTKDGSRKDRMNAKQPAGGFVPYKLMSTIDGDTAQQQRDKVTDEIANYLRRADEKRQKKAEVDNKKAKYSDQPKDTNQFSERIESVNSRLGGSLQAMRGVVSASKALTSQQNKILDVQDIDTSGENIE